MWWYGICQVKCFQPADIHKSHKAMSCHQPHVAAEPTPGQGLLGAAMQGCQTGIPHAPCVQGLILDDEIVRRYIVPK